MIGTTTENNSIEFANLSEGDYTLRIKAKTQHGVVGEESIVKFTIKPHFWKSKLCNVFIFIINSRSGYLEIRYRVDKLDRLVNEKTVDLRYADG